MLRIFGLSAATTVAALGAAFIYGLTRNGTLSAGVAALVLCFILGVMEVSLSFDNAVVNALFLEKLNARWQQIFLTVGVLIATFGMRFTLPVLVVWATAGLNPARALHLAFNPPAHGAAYYPDHTPSYATYLDHAHPLIAAFGGMFLLLIFLDFAFDSERDIMWLSWLERPLAWLGRFESPWDLLLKAGVALAALIVLTFTLVPHIDRRIVLIGGILGALSNLVVAKLGDMFDTERTGEVVVKLVGRAALMTFLYLEVLDASFSFDGVMGAFAISSDPVIIMLGLGFIGAVFVRSLTVLLVRRGTLAEYVYLEHGAMWAIGTLSVLMLVSVGVHISSLITGLAGVALIVSAFLTSVLTKEDEEEIVQQPGSVPAT